MLTYLLTALLPSSHCLLLLSASFSGQLSQADCSLRPSFVNWLSLSSLGLSFPRSLPVSWSGPLRGFRAKTDKKTLWVAPTQTETNATHRVSVLKNKKNIRKSKPSSKYRKLFSQTMVISSYLRKYYFVFMDWIYLWIYAILGRIHYIISRFEFRVFRLLDWMPYQN